MLIGLSQLFLYDTDVRNTTTHVSIPSTDSIIRSHLTFTHIAICTSSQVHLYKHTSDSIRKLGMYDTAHNPAGLCVLGNRVCVFPGRTEGQIQLVRLPQRTKGGEDNGKLAVILVAAHAGALRALCLSPDEEVVASASANVRITSAETYLF